MSHMNSLESYTRDQGWRRQYELMRVSADVGLARHTARHAFRQRNMQRQWVHSGAVQHGQDEMQQMRQRALQRITAIKI